MLAADGCSLECIVATLWGLRPLVVDRRRLVLVFGLFLGLGAVPLWALGLPGWSWLGLGA